MKAIIEAWRGSPAIRMLARTIVVAAAVYIVTALKQGEAIDLTALGTAVAVSGLTALTGLLTPLEPFVGPGFAKPDRVEVPRPPAVLDNAKPAKA